jgi:hypothetical protein
VLTACGGIGKKPDVFDAYGQSGTPASHPVIIDNDSYYSQPGSYQPSYKGCTNINDAPSCGGG